MRSFKLVTEAKHCIRQSVLQGGPNAVLCSYIASLLLSTLNTEVYYTLAAKKPDSLIMSLENTIEQ